MKCNDAIRIINKLNQKLPLDKIIRIVDCSEWEEFGLRSIPLMQTFEKMGLDEGYPFLYIDGIIIDPAPTPEQLKVLLHSFLKEDILF